MNWLTIHINYHNLIKIISEESNQNLMSMIASCLKWLAVLILVELEKTNIKTIAMMKVKKMKIMKIQPLNKKNPKKSL